MSTRQSLLLGLLVIFMSHPICAGEAKTTNTKLPEILKPVGKDYVDNVFERLLNEDLLVKSFFIHGEAGLGRTSAKNINFAELDDIIDLKCVVDISSVVAAGSRERLLRQFSSLLRSREEYSIPRELFIAYVKELKTCKYFLHDDITLEGHFAKKPEGFLRSAQYAQPAVFAYVYRGDRLDYIVQVTNAVTRDFFGNNISIFVMLHDEKNKIKDFRVISVKADTDGCAAAAQKIWDHLNIGGVIKDKVRESLFLPHEMNDKAMPLDEFM